MSDDDKQKVMHIALPIGNNDTLMATDFVESMGQKLSPGNNFSLTVHPEREAEADKFFQLLSAGGEITMPLE
ncbi:MAG: VOC family protein, partial [Ferruginibacter sp.]